MGSRVLSPVLLPGGSRTLLSSPTITSIDSPSTSPQQGSPPGACHDSCARYHQQGIRHSVRTPPALHHQFCADAKRETEEKAEQVRTEIGIFTTGTEHREQAESCSDRYGPAATWAQVVTITHHTDGGEDADGAEDGRGGADRAVGGVLQPGVEQVAKQARGDQQQPGWTGAQVAAESGDEDPADQQVAKQMLGANNAFRPAQVFTFLPFSL